jgi:hypothetical protein
LRADRGAFGRIARPQLEGILPPQPHIQAALDVALLARAEACEFAQFGNGQRSSSGIRHGVFLRPGPGPAPAADHARIMVTDALTMMRANSGKAQFFRFCAAMAGFDLPRAIC